MHCLRDASFLHKRQALTRHQQILNSKQNFCKHIFGKMTEQSRHQSVEIKMNALHRCFKLGEDVEYVSRDIGYNRAGIYTWRRKYLKKGMLALITTNNLSRGNFPKKMFQMWKKTTK
ncbi:hypothetical protein AALB39_28245 [Lachnospiraceae bacterium 54-53]